MPGKSYWNKRNKGRIEADNYRSRTGAQIDRDAWRRQQQTKKTLGPKGIFQDLYRDKDDTTAVVNYIIKNIGEDGKYIFTPEVVEKWIQEIDPGFEMPALPEPTKRNKDKDKRGNDR